MLTLSLALLTLLSPIVDDIKLPYNESEGIPPSTIEGTVIDVGSISHIDGVLIEDTDWITLKAIIEGTDYCEVISDIAGEEVVKQVSKARDACVSKRKATIELNKKLKDLIKIKTQQVDQAQKQERMYKYVATGTTAVALAAVTFFIIR